MNCKRCNSPISENELFCPKCGYRGRLEEQKLKIRQLKIKHRSTVMAKSRSPFMLITAILVTLMAVARLLPLGYGDYSCLISSAFLILSAVGFWMAFGTKEHFQLAKSLRMASIYDAYVRVLYTVGIIFGSITLALSVVGVFILAGGTLLRNSRTEPVISAQALFLLGMMLLIFGACAIILAISIREVFAKRRAYFVKLSRFIECGDYTDVKDASVSSYVLAAAAVVMGILSIFMAVQLVSNFNSLISMTSDAIYDMIVRAGLEADPDNALGFVGTLELMSIFFDITQVIGVFVSTFYYFVNLIISYLSAICAVGGIALIVLGAYLVVSGIWISTVHRELEPMRREIDRENIIRLDIDRRTKQAIAEFAAERERLKAGGDESDATEGLAAEENAEGAVEPIETIAEEPVEEIADETDEEISEPEEASDEVKSNEPIEVSFRDITDEASTTDSDSDEAAV